MTLRKEIIDALVAGGMHVEDASDKVRRIVEESRSAGWSKGYDEGYDECLHQSQE